MTKRFFAKLMLSVALLASPVRAGEAPIAHAPLDQASIEYRQHNMNALEAQFKAIAAIVAFDGPPANLMSHLQTALILARQVLPSFEKPAPGGSAQPEIWSSWEDYTHHMRQFEASIAMAIEAAKFGSVTDVVWYTDQISCRKCHDTYKQRTVRGREEYLGY
jgi:cytochrome c556